MALAPLDVWARLLVWPPAFVPPRFWPRLALGFFTSFFGTVGTLPERLALAPVLWCLGRRRRHVIDHPPGVVVVLGYFRTGTTHLHYLLSCDRRFNTPRWHQALVPQGWLLAWGFLRFFLIPFQTTTRPQDDMAFGPEWPAEDDFAVNNWSLASSLPGRFVLHGRHAHYRRFHDLERLRSAELARWRRYQWAFLWKVIRRAPSRALLLKSPSHTARIPELISLFSPWQVKFVHISREPSAVVRSNVAMHNRFAVYALQELPDPLEAERRITEEYLATEERFERGAAILPRGHLARVRFEDLVADPMGQLERIYAELGIEWTTDARARVLHYLDAVRDYRAATPAGPRQDGGGQGMPDQAGHDRLAALAARRGHARPPVPRVPLPEVVRPDPPGRARKASAFGVTVLAAAVCAGAWFALALAVQNRHDWLVWPTGIVVGLTARRMLGTGSPALGVVAAGVTLGTLLVLAMPLSRYVYFGDPDKELIHVWLKARRELTAEPTLFWTFMGLVSAYRFASRKHADPPGRRAAIVAPVGPAVGVAGASSEGEKPAGTGRASEVEPGTRGGVGAKAH